MFLRLGRRGIGQPAYQRRVLIYGVLGAIVMRAEVPSFTMIPAGAIIRSGSDIHQYRLTNQGEQTYKEGVFEASARLRDGYIALYRDGVPESGED